MKLKFIFILLTVMFLVGCDDTTLDQKIYVEDECDGVADMSFHLEDDTLIPFTNVEYYVPIAENEDGTFDYRVVSTYSDGYDDVVENIVEAEVVCRNTD